MDGGELVSAGGCVYCMVYGIFLRKRVSYRIVSVAGFSKRQETKKKGPRRVGTADSSGQAG